MIQLIKDLISDYKENKQIELRQYVCAQVRRSISK